MGSFEIGSILEEGGGEGGCDDNLGSGRGPSRFWAVCDLIPRTMHVSLVISGGRSGSGEAAMQRSMGRGTFSEVHHCDKETELPRASASCCCCCYIRASTDLT